MIFTRHINASNLQCSDFRRFQFQFIRSFVLIREIFLEIAVANFSAGINHKRLTVNVNFVR